MICEVQEGFLKFVYEGVLGGADCRNCQTKLSKTVAIHTHWSSVQIASGLRAHLKQEDWSELQAFGDWARLAGDVAVGKKLRFTIQCSFTMSLLQSCKY